MRRRKVTFDTRKVFSNNGLTQCVSIPKPCCDWIELEAGDTVEIYQQRAMFGAPELRDGDIIVRKIQEEK